MAVVNCRRHPVFRKYRRDKAAALANWADFVDRMELETGDDGFLGVVKRMANA